jgi:hypothetical protein
MSLSNIGLAAIAVAVAAAPALAGNWTAQGADGGHGERLTLKLDDNGRSYVIECAPDAVVVVQNGAAELVDLPTKTKIGDAPGSTMLPGASVMALFTGASVPAFKPATAVPNPVKGWDLTLRFAKDDEALKGLDKAEVVMLFTTGVTDMIPLDADDHKLFAGFVARCRG